MPYFKIKERKIITILLAIAFICGYNLPTNYAITTSNQWGLSFQKDNNIPIPNMKAEDLKKYNAYYCDTKDEKKIYITFDAGFENGNTEPILQALKAHNVTAVFFLVGTYFETNPDIVKQIVADGHIIGNHSYHHPDMTTKSKEEFTKELQLTETAYQNVVNKTMENKFYRPPEGSFNQETLQWANELGYKTLFWSLAYVDWEKDNQPTKEYAFEKLIPRTHNGAIVLLHSTSKTNAEILDELLTKWESEGYSFGNPKEIS